MKTYVAFNIHRLREDLNLTDEQILIYKHSKYEEWRNKYLDLDFVEEEHIDPGDIPKDPRQRRLYLDAITMRSIAKSDQVLLQKGWAQDERGSFIFMVVSQYGIPIIYEDE